MNETPGDAPVVAQRWLATLLDPLITTQRRIEIDSDVHALIEARPDWCSVFAGGVLSALVLSLPNDDMWRDSHEDLPTTTSASIPLFDVGMNQLTPDAWSLTVQARQGWRVARSAIQELYLRESPRIAFHEVDVAIRHAARHHRDFRPGLSDTWLIYVGVEWSQRTSEILETGSLEWFDEATDADIAREREVLRALTNQEGEQKPH